MGGKQIVSKSCQCLWIFPKQKKTEQERYLIGLSKLTRIGELECFSLSPKL
uniref:Uncharacterized protein n=1 Tax=Setaria viridis TaxID=4556 RepID=A0A4U6TLX1_SETVI|nr:hypothetical protein SEVIR_8G232500v2 [Setaria viridis]